MPDHLIVLEGEELYITPAEAKPGRYVGWVRDEKRRTYVEKNVPLFYKDGLWERPMGLGGAYPIDVKDIVKVRIGDWIIK